MSNVQDRYHQERQAAIAERRNIFQMYEDRLRAQAAEGVSGFTYSGYGRKLSSGPSIDVLHLVDDHVMRANSLLALRDILTQRDYAKAAEWFASNIPELLWSIPNGERSEFFEGMRAQMEEDRNDPCNWRNVAISAIAVDEFWKDVAKIVARSAKGKR